jgi:hypothetical protein
VPCSPLFATPGCSQDASAPLTSISSGPRASGTFTVPRLIKFSGVITTIDKGGVALAAIQELYHRVLEKSAQIEAQKEQISKLTTEVEKLQHVEDRLAAVEARLARTEASN